MSIHYDLPASGYAESAHRDVDTPDTPEFSVLSLSAVDLPDTQELLTAPHDEDVNIAGEPEYMAFSTVDTPRALGAQYFQPSILKVLERN